MGIWRRFKKINFWLTFRIFCNILIVGARASVWGVCQMCLSKKSWRNCEGFVRCTCLKKAEEIIGNWMVPVFTLRSIKAISRSTRTLSRCLMWEIPANSQKEHIYASGANWIKMLSISPFGTTWGQMWGNLAGLATPSRRKKERMPDWIFVMSWLWIIRYISSFRQSGKYLPPSIDIFYETMKPFKRNLQSILEAIRKLP